MTDGEQRELVTLREYLEHMITSLDKRIDERLVLRDREQAMRDDGYQRRLEELNHMQRLMQDERSHFMPRELSEQRANLISERASTITSRLDKLEGKSVGVSAFWGILVAVAMFILGVVGFMVKR